MDFKKIVFKTGVLAISLLAAGAANAQAKTYTIGTNPSGSTFYIIGSGFAKLFQEKLGVRSTVQPNTGSSVYLPMISMKDLNLGVSNGIEVGMAYRGEGDYPVEMENLRALARVWVLPYAYVTTGESGIETIEDLSGKRVMGKMSTNIALTEVNKAMLASGGLSEDEVDFASSGGLMDGIEAVVQGRADAAPVATTMPVLVESHTSAPGGLRIVSNGTKASDDFYEGIIPGLREIEVKPNERYPFIVGETSVAAYDVLLLTHSDLADEEAYKLVKTLYENWPSLQEDVPPLRRTSQSDLAKQELTIPYHPGAEQYYKEAGIWESKETNTN